MRRKGTKSLSMYSIVISMLLLFAVPVLSWGATISGTVRDSAGNPVTGNRVSVNVIAGDPCNNTQRVEGTETDPANGTYTVVVPAGTYYLLTHYNETNYVNEWWNGVSPDPSDRDCSLAQSITVASGDSVTNSDFWLEIGSTISGTVRDSTGTPITGDQIHVGVSIGDPCGNTQGVDGTWTDPTDGTYKVVVSAGTYFLKTWHWETNYIDEWWNGASPDPSDYDCSLAQSITVTSGEATTGKDFNLDLGGSITGTVYAGDGVTPVTGVEINVNAMRGDQCHEWLSGGGGTNTNPDDGTYTIIPDGHPKSPTYGHLKIPHPPGLISQ